MNRECYSNKQLSVIIFQIPVTQVSTKCLNWNFQNMRKKRNTTMYISVIFRKPQHKSELLDLKPKTYTLWGINYS